MAISGCSGAPPATVSIGWKAEVQPVSTAVQTVPSDIYVVASHRYVTVLGGGDQSQFSRDAMERISE